MYLAPEANSPGQRCQRWMNKGFFATTWPDIAQRWRCIDVFYSENTSWSTIKETFFTKGKFWLGNAHVLRSPVYGTAYFWVFYKLGNSPMYWSDSLFTVLLIKCMNDDSQEGEKNEKRRV